MRSAPPCTSAWSVDAPVEGVGLHGGGLVQVVLGVEDVEPQPLEGVRPRASAGPRAGPRRCRERVRLSSRRRSSGGGSGSSRRRRRRRRGHGIDSPLPSPACFHPQRRPRRTRSPTTTRSRRRVRRSLRRMKSLGSHDPWFISANEASGVRMRCVEEPQPLGLVVLREEDGGARQVLVRSRARSRKDVRSPEPHALEPKVGHA